MRAKEPFARIRGRVPATSGGDRRVSACGRAKPLPGADAGVRVAASTLGARRSTRSRILDIQVQHRVSVDGWPSARDSRLRRKATAI
jgi:hypothetical protein